MKSVSNATHKTYSVRKCLAARPNWHAHFIPTPSLGKIAAFCGKLA